MDTIRHYANFPATGVSLRQMVQFGDKPSTGMCLPPPIPLLNCMRMVDADIIAKAPCSGPHNSLPRNSQSAWRTASRNWTSYPMD